MLRLEQHGRVGRFRWRLVAEVPRGGGLRMEIEPLTPLAAEPAVPPVPPVLPR